MRKIYVHPIRRRRMELGMKQLQLIALTGISQSSVSNYEAGKTVSDHHIAPLAKALRWTVDDLCKALGYVTQ